MIKLDWEAWRLERYRFVMPWLSCQCISISVKYWYCYDWRQSRVQFLQRRNSQTNSPKTISTLESSKLNLKLPFPGILLLRLATSVPVDLIDPNRSKAILVHGLEVSCTPMAGNRNSPLPMIIEILGSEESHAFQTARVLLNSSSSSTLFSTRKKFGSKLVGLQAAFRRETRKLKLADGTECR